IFGHAFCLSIETVVHLLVAASLSAALTILTVALMGRLHHGSARRRHLTSSLVKKQREECLAAFAVMARSSIAEGLAEGVVRRRSRGHHRDPGRTPIL